METVNRRAHWFAIAWTLGVAAFLLFGPVYSGRTTALGADGTMVESQDPPRSLLDANGARALIAVSIPVLLAAAPLPVGNPARRRLAGVASGFVLFLFAFLTGFSVGMLYHPAWIAMLLAFATPRPASPESSSGA